MTFIMRFGPFAFAGLLLYLLAGELFSYPALPPRLALALCEVRDALFRLWPLLLGAAYWGSVAAAALLCLRLLLASLARGLTPVQRWVNALTGLLCGMYALLVPYMHRMAHAGWSWVPTFNDLFAVTTLFALGVLAIVFMDRATGDG